MLTKLSGDQSVWSVYLTIGNRNMETEDNVQDQV